MKLRTQEAKLIDKAVSLQQITLPKISVALKDEDRITPSKGYERN
jgi:hypothetical protein